MFQAIPKLVPDDAHDGSTSAHPLDLQALALTSKTPGLQEPPSAVERSTPFSLPPDSQEPSVRVLHVCFYFHTRLLLCSWDHCCVIEENLPHHMYVSVYLVLTEGHLGAFALKHRPKSLQGLAASVWHHVQDVQSTTHGSGVAAAESIEKVSPDSELHRAFLGPAGMLHKALHILYRTRCARRVQVILYEETLRDAHPEQIHWSILSIVRPSMRFTAYYHDEHNSAALSSKVRDSMAVLFSDRSVVSVEFASHQSTVIYLCVLSASSRARSIGQIVAALHSCCSSGRKPLIAVEPQPNTAYEIIEEGTNSKQSALVYQCRPALVGAVLHAFTMPLWDACTGRIILP